MPLLLQLLLPLVLLVLGDGLLRAWLLWHNTVQHVQQQAQSMASDFNTGHGARIAELSSQGQTAELQALLNREVGSYAALALVQWRSSTGQTLQAHAAPTPLLAPEWLLPSSDDGDASYSQSFALSYQNRPAGTLTLRVTPVPELNSAWPALRQQLWLVGLMLVGSLMLMGLVLWANLRGLLQLTRAAHQLPSKPDLRIRPSGSRELR